GTCVNTSTWRNASGSMVAADLRGTAPSSQGGVAAAEQLAELAQGRDELPGDPAGHREDQDRRHPFRGPVEPRRPPHERQDERAEGGRAQHDDPERRVVPGERRALPRAAEAAVETGTVDGAAAAPAWPRIRHRKESRTKRRGRGAGRSASIGRGGGAWWTRRE